MGSRPKQHVQQIKLAYIAGFFDGDGSLMLQVKKRSDTPHGWRFMVTICFYQDSRHAKPLLWIRNTFKIGYIFNRNDGITELRINGYAQCTSILEQLHPYIQFKKPQVEIALKALKLLRSKSTSKLTTADKRRLLDWVIRLQKHNYHSGHKRSKVELCTLLGLTP